MGYEWMRKQNKHWFATTEQKDEFIEFTTGAIVVATGYDMLDPERRDTGLN